MSLYQAYDLGRLGALANCVQTLELLLENYNGNVEYLLEDIRSGIQFHTAELDEVEERVLLLADGDTDAYLEGAFRAIDATPSEIHKLKTKYDQMGFAEWMDFAYDCLTPGYNYPRPSPEKLKSWVEGFLSATAVVRAWDER